MSRKRRRLSPRTTHPCLVAGRGPYFIPLLERSLQPMRNPLMVWCPFQKKCAPEHRKSSPTAFPAMVMYLSLSSSYIIRRIRVLLGYYLSRLQTLQRNVKLPCIHLFLQNQVIPWMSFKLARDSKPFNQNQSNGESNKNPPPIMKMILRDQVEPKSKGIATTNFLPM